LASFIDNYLSKLTLCADPPYKPLEKAEDAACDTASDADERMEALARESVTGMSVNPDKFEIGQVITCYSLSTCKLDLPVEWHQGTLVTHMFVRRTSSNNASLRCSRPSLAAMWQAPASL
jgi:hypothetical protein